MTIDRRKRIAFEEVADLYDEVRPGYPEELVAGGWRGHIWWRYFMRG